MPENTLLVLYFFVQRFKLRSLAVLLHGTWGRFRQKIESVTSHFFKSQFKGCCELLAPDRMQCSPVWQWERYTDP